MRGERLATGGAVLTALAASLCCTGPLLFVAFGVGAFGAATIFAPLRPYLLAVAALALAFGFYRAYFRRETCAPGEACASEPASRASRLSLWGALAAVLFFALSPLYAGPLERRLSAPRASANAPAERVSRRETYKVSGMTCAGCEATIHLALEGTPGVRGSEVSYDRGEAFVEYDPRVTDAEKIRKAIDETGYACEVKK